METTVLEPTEFANAVEEHQFDSADDARKVIVGLQEQFRSAEIYAEYAHLYSREQVDALARARDAASDEAERERLHRLWFEAAGSLAARDVIEAMQALSNDQLNYRATWDGEEVTLNTIGALISSEPDFDRREALYALACEADEHFATRELDLAVEAQRIRSEVFGIEGEVALAEARMGIDLHEFSKQIRNVADQTKDAYRERASESFGKLLGRDTDLPSRAHAAYMRSLHIYDEIFTQDKMVSVCEQTLIDLGFDLDQIPTILPDLEDRPQKTPRACVIPTRVPDTVHLVVRPTGGITDYQAFLHEAGHALHFGLTDSALPFAWRALSPDNALTEIYSYVVERITHEPAWHERHFGVDRATAEQICADTRFIDASLFRRYGAKLQYELEFWADPTDPRHADRYAMLLTEQTQMRYPTSQYVSDMDPGLYAADYLRAWRTSEQVIAKLRELHGEMWFTNAEAGAWLRGLFTQGTKPTNEEISLQIGSSPTDYSALIAKLTN